MTSNVDQLGERSIEVGSVDGPCRVRRRGRYETMSEPRVHTDLLHAIEASSMIAARERPTSIRSVCGPVRATTVLEVRSGRR